VINKFEHYQGTTIERPEKFNLPSRIKSPGLYSAHVKTASAIGYQHHDPKIWFKLLEIDNGGEPNKGFKIVQLEDDPYGETRIPNLRLTNFRDFHVFTGSRNPNDIRKKNKLLIPPVDLRIIENRSVEASGLDRLEQMPKLFWWIYRDGHLIDRMPVDDSRRLTVDEGIGNYYTFIAVEGPNGFMPVSNIVNFPLFPKKGGGFECFPMDHNGNQLPDCLEDSYNKEQQGGDLDE
jgi:hypothetical protein